MVSSSDNFVEGKEASSAGNQGDAEYARNPYGNDGARYPTNIAHN